MPSLVRTLAKAAEYLEFKAFKQFADFPFRVVPGAGLPCHRLMLLKVLHVLMHLATTDHISVPWPCILPHAEEVDKVDADLLR